VTKAGNASGAGPNGGESVGGGLKRSGRRNLGDEVVGEDGDSSSSDKAEGEDDDDDDVDSD